MAVMQCATLVLSHSPSFSRLIKPKGTTIRLLAILCLVACESFGGESVHTLQSFGVRVEHGRIVYPLPSHVALGLFNPDPLLDAAYCAEGKVQVYQNLGDGTFGAEPVWERPVSGEVEKVEWKLRQSATAGIADPNSRGDIVIHYADGRSEVITHEQMQTREDNLPRGGFASVPAMDPPLSFHEVWRSAVNNAPANQVAMGDIDNDGRIELGYWFYPVVGSGDTTRRFVVYENQGNDTYVVEWDTVLDRSSGGIYGISDIDNNGHKEWDILASTGATFLECYGPRQYRVCRSNLYPPLPGITFKMIESDVKHDGTKDISMLISDPSRSIDPTIVLVGEFAGRSILPNGDYLFAFNQQIARYQGYVFDMAIGQVDGQGWDEIVPAGGSFGVNEPVPIDYLWYSGVPGADLWKTREIYTGLQSGTGAVMFVNLDADTAMEFVSGAPGPIGHGSMFALKYQHDTTWSVMWADSSLRNSPLWVNSGYLNGQFVAAGANTWHPADSLYSELHTYLPSGNKYGVWHKDSLSIQDFHFADIDHDGRTNLVFAQIANYNVRLEDYESDTIVVAVNPPSELPGKFELFQNYPNPFNPTTAITFYLPLHSHVEIRIYDILGKEVRALVKNDLPQGTHTVSWNGITNEGGDAASGVYFYRMTVLEGRGTLFAQTRKLLLLR